MILLYLHKKDKVTRVLQDNSEIQIISKQCVDAFWEMAKKFPEEIIGWCEEKYVNDLNMEYWTQIFHHDLIMASYAIDNSFFPDSIGYIDQLPFVNINRNVHFGTWQMSSDVGGIRGKVLLQFNPLLKNIKDFDFLLNSIAKIGQQNGLFCYSSPLLVKSPIKNVSSTASNSQLFQFVYSHYNTIWTSVLLWCFIKYEKEFPLLPYLKSFFYKSYFKKEVNLSGFNIQIDSNLSSSASIDVIIPNMGRAKYVMQFLEDLKGQILLPKKVIIVEQNSNKNSVSELNKMDDKNYPFEIVHHFIHQTGACNARNIALKEVSAEWIFFADDDIRISSNLLKNAMEVVQNKYIDALNMNCKQQGEETIFNTIKQWGSFGSGTSIVKTSFAEKCNFSLIYEHGYGEDIDFGMQLRNEGCDIIYHPHIEILHLKAPIGGFREKPVLAWELEEPLPKPSPTLMAFALKYYTPQQIKGFKTSLFLKYYNKQSVKNPLTYLESMRLRWEKSEKWAFKMINE